MTRNLLISDTPACSLSKTVEQLRSSGQFTIRHSSNAEQFCLELTHSTPHAVLVSMPALLAWGGDFFRQLRTLLSGATVIVLNRVHGNQLAVRAFSDNKDLNSAAGSVIRDILCAIDPESGCCQHLITNRACFGFQVPSQIDRLSAVVDLIENFAAFRSPLSEQECLGLRMAVTEALTNAIIHGNLEVASMLKEQDDAAFDSLVKLRQVQLPYAGRRVNIFVEANRSEFRCRITDEGRGFDLNKLDDPLSPENLSKPSGRGILLMQSAMDSVHWNAEGNEVELVKNFEHTLKTMEQSARSREARQAVYSPV